MDGENESFLVACLTARQTGIPLSRRFAIKDWWTATDLDNAATIRLRQFDLEDQTMSMKNQARLIAFEVSKIFSDGNDDDDDPDVGNAEVW